MVFQCQLTQAELREAIRMNRTASFWFRTVIGNIRMILLGGVVLVAVIVKIAHRDTSNWEAFAGLCAFMLALVAFVFWRRDSALKKAAATLNAACGQMTLDAQGVTTLGASGSTTFAPWSQFGKWKEGRLVFTIGDAKAFRTVPKSALNESQVGEVRGLLQSQIR